MPRTVVPRHPRVSMTRPDPAFSNVVTDLDKPNLRPDNAFFFLRKEVGGRSVVAVVYKLSRFRFKLMLRNTDGEVRVERFRTGNNAALLGSMWVHRQLHA